MSHSSYAAPTFCRIGTYTLWIHENLQAVRRVEDWRGWF